MKSLRKGREGRDDEGRCGEVVKIEWRGGGRKEGDNKGRGGREEIERGKENG